MAKLSKKRKLFVGSANLIYVGIAILAILLLAYVVFEFVVMA